MSYPPQYYGVPNGFPHSTNGPNQQHQFPQQQQQSQDQQHNPSKGPMMPNGPPAAIVNSQPAVAQPLNAVAGGPPKAHPLPSQGAMPTQNSNWAQNWAATNGNSTTSSRTSSPALGSNGMPPTSGVPKVPSLTADAIRGYATSNNNTNNNNLPPMASSQSQPTPAVSQSLQTGYNLRPNNNSFDKLNVGGINLVNTPPKSASGMSTPLNASTPTLTGPTVLSGQQQAMQKLTSSVQDLSLQRPPVVGKAPQVTGTTMMPQPNFQQSLQPSTPMTNGNSGQPGAMPASNFSTQAAMNHLPYGHLPPASNLQYQPLQQQTQPLQQQVQQQQQQQNSAPFSMSQGPPPMMNGPGSTNHAFPTVGAGMVTTQQPQPQQQQHQLAKAPDTANHAFQAGNAGMVTPQQYPATGKLNAPPPTTAAAPSAPSAGQPMMKRPIIFRCTLNKIPESLSLLNKSRLPLGLLIHPFRDLNNLPVISCNAIVRCKTCRTYINPFVFFTDSKKWQCNLCYRTNELPEEFQYDPVTKTFGDPTRRPEIKSSTIEFIAPAEYMLRPPQPAIYLFLLDVSSLAQQSGYLYTVCNTLMEHLDNLPGDARTQVGFIAFNSAIHFYNISEDYNQPHEVTVLDVEDVFLPYPDNLLVNLKECKEMIMQLLKQLPKRFEHTHDTHSALGAALQVAYKLMSNSGGRVTVFQTCLPNYGPGALQSRENPNNRSSKEVAHLGPATDFYKRLALECSAGISKFSGGCMYHIPLYSESKPQLVKTLRKSLERYLTRKIGFEAVMRVRCTRGLTIHTFHGNFFVRSTDLLSLPNVNPDAGFGMQITYEESLTKVKTVCFQAALLYTSSKAERRIRVHTLCIPVTESLSEVMYSADPQCIVGLLSKMAVDRSVTSSLSDARDAFVNATVDIISAFRLVQNLAQTSSKLVVPENLKLLPLYILAMLKHPAFRTGTSTRLDDRVFAMSEMKSLPLDQLIRYIYPDFYLLDCLFVSGSNGYVDDGHKLEPIRMQLSAEKLDSRSMFLLDCGPFMYIYIGSNVASSIVQDILGYNSVAEIPDFCIELPSRKTKASEALLGFLESIDDEKPYASYVQVIRDTSQFRSVMIEKFVDDRNPNSLSYYEFLQHLSAQVK
uniref:Uncharacterized protein n=1 Tax=Anopheles culicifacies TaxID=139723 RepID=A0A182MLE2_9DIPT